MWRYKSIECRGHLADGGRSGHERDGRRTSQFALFEQQRTETETSYEPVIWPPYLGREVPLSGAKVQRGEAFSSLRALREALQRATREGSNPPVSRGVGHLDGVSNPCTQGASEFLLYSVRLLQCPTRSTSADPGPTMRTRLERDFDRNRPGAPAAYRR